MRIDYADTSFKRTEERLTIGRFIGATLFMAGVFVGLPFGFWLLSLHG